MWNTVLFDLDGTLTDSGEGITKSVQYALKKGFGIEVEDLHKLDCFVGPPLKEQFMSFAGLNGEQAEEAIRVYRERYSVTGIFENRLYEGIAELLEQLHAEGMQIAVASSKPTEFCRKILEHFGVAEYFSEIVGSEMNGGRTKKSEVVEEVLRRLGRSDAKEEVVLIGDRSYDVIGAKEAGIGSIGVTYGYGSREELEAEWPDCICDSAEEVRNVLIGQFRDGLKELDHAQKSGSSGNGVRPFEFRDDRNGTSRDLRKTGSIQSYDGTGFTRVWTWFSPFLIDLAVSYALTFLVIFVFRLVGPAKDYEEIYSDCGLLLTAMADLILLPIFIKMFLSDEKKRIDHGTEAFRIPCILKMSWWDFVRISLFSIFLNGALELLISLIPYEDTRYEVISDMLSNPGMLIQVFAIGLIGPVVEEFLFRGLLYRRFRDSFGVYAAAVFSSVLFGLAHGSLTQGLFAALFGIALSLIYEHYGTLRAPIAAHLANNLFALLTQALADVIPAGFWYFYFTFSSAFAILFGIMIFYKNNRRNPV